MIGIGVLSVMKMSDFKWSKEFVIRHNTPLKTISSTTGSQGSWRQLTLNLLLNFPTSSAPKYRSMLLFNIFIYFGTGP